MSVQLLLLVSFSSTILGVLSYSPLLYYKQSQYYYPQSYGSSYDTFCCWFYYNPSQSYSHQPYLQYPLSQPMYSQFMYPSNPVNTHGFHAKHYRPMNSRPTTFGHHQQHFQNYPMLLPFPYPFGVPQMPVQQTSTAILMPKTSPTTSKPTSQATYATRTSTPPIATTATPTVTSTKRSFATRTTTAPTVTSRVPSFTRRTTDRSLFFNFFGTNNPDHIPSSFESTTKYPTTLGYITSSTMNINRNKEYGFEVDSDIEAGSGLQDTDDEDLI